MATIINVDYWVIKNSVQIDWSLDFEKIEISRNFAAVSKFRK